MLTAEVMGLLCLAILWVNTLLCAGAALRPLGEHLAWLGHMRRHGMVRARVTSPGVLASHTVDQVGRRASDDAARQAILFHDRGHRGELAGGRVEADGVELQLPPGDAEVWFRRRDQLRAAEPGDAPFEPAYASAGKAKGFSRAVRCELAEGDDVWLVGPRDGDTLRPLLVASFDPQGLLRARAALVVGAQLAMLALAAAITWVCLYPPRFGVVSLVGAGAGLAYFLLVQPAGVSLREATLLPSRALLRGSWTRAGSEGKGAPRPGSELYAD